MENNYTGIRYHITDTLIHKQFFTRSCYKLVQYLYDVGRDDEALELAKRSASHDDSKLEAEEIESFIKLPAEGGGCKNHKQPLSEEQKKLIAIHWKKNRHHPEYFSTYHHMSEIDIMEMCCDWHARSVQFGNELIPFVVEQQKYRFNFDDEFFKKIMFYCEILIGPDHIL